MGEGLRRGGGREEARRKRSRGTWPRTGGAEKGRGENRERLRVEAGRCVGAGLEEAVRREGSCPGHGKGW